MSKRAILFGLLTAVLLAAGFPSASEGQRSSRRIVAMGDIHGNVEEFSALLQRVGILDSEGRWIARDVTLVQTGDFLDRGPDSRAVMDLLMRLEREAPRNGGRVIVLLGNHEVLNIVGDLRYVSDGEYASFADDRSERRRQDAYDAYVASVTRGARAAFEDPDAQPLELDEWTRSRPLGFVEHREAFSRNGRYGRWLRSLPAVVQLDGNIFLHGGISPELMSWSIRRLNETVEADIEAFDAYREYLIRERLALPFHTMGELLGAARTAMENDVDPRGPRLQNFLRLGSWTSMHPDGPLWFRGFARWTEEEGAETVAALLEAYRAERFVVGHTPTPEIRTRFDGRVVLLDTGMTEGRSGALEIRDGRLTAHYMDRSQALD